ncbi:hypothetical protein SKAU_G00310130 [Synaphobranchus kaupii]|uniref:Uncharacterized protein n=1 Tax=Synaphobranchus kaupii TaxID=118154 RepID=A0A9Q1ERG2_SYNKA|nr:hypothetical protein SKAU_G00310130 [Synaphobranchus kaupii]
MHAVVIIVTLGGRKAPQWLRVKSGRAGRVVRPALCPRGSGRGSHLTFIAPRGFARRPSDSRPRVKAPWSVFQDRVGWVADIAADPWHLCVGRSRGSRGQSDPVDS